MNKIDDILESLKGQQPMIDDPEALTDRIMDSLPDLEPNQQEDESKARIVDWRWPAILAVAASVAVALIFVWPKMENNPEEPMVVAQTITNDPTPADYKSEPNGHAVRTDEPNKQNELQPQVADDTNDHHRADYLPLPKSSNEPQLHYAAIKSAVDAVYQDPSRVDDFIAKMADFNEVEGISLDCTGGAPDSTVVSKAYVFDDTQELDVFGRLLQVACWYDSKTPGYLLNFSHQQLFFTLKDLHKGQKYLWIAERIMGDRILLYCTHSPIETNVSSTCYQKYREQLTHTIFSSSQF